MQLSQFLDSSYTSYHAVANVVSMLDKAGFVQVNLDSDTVKVGGRYYTVRNGSAIVAFVVGEGDRFLLAMSHTDSPSLHIKGEELILGGGVARANIEMYGGALASTFMDRQLKIAGRVIVDSGNGVESQLVDSSYSVVIPSVAIHHNPTANSGTALNMQSDMLPIVGIDEVNLYSTLTTEKVIDADLYVVPAQPSFISGRQGELLCSARIDNLTSVYTSINALIDSRPDGVAVCACFDNEEIGSGTKQGAKSRWFDSVLAKIACDTNKGDYNNMLRRSFALSIDNGHAVHPAHPEKYDLTNKVFMGKGIVIKHNTNYATDGMSSAIFKKCLDNCGIAHQDYYNRSDIRSGGTLGLCVSTQLDMYVCDIGLAQLAMHSACETVSVADVCLMTDAVRAVFNSNIVVADSSAVV